MSLVLTLTNTQAFSFTLSLSFSLSRTLSPPHSLSLSCFLDARTHAYTNTRTHAHARTHAQRMRARTHMHTLASLPFVPPSLCLLLCTTHTCARACPPGRPEPTATHREGEEWQIESAARKTRTRVHGVEHVSCATSHGWVPQPVLWHQ